MRPELLRSDAMRPREVDAHISRIVIGAPPTERARVLLLRRVTLFVVHVAILSSRAGLERTDMPR
jgi:hypothetical protein